MPIETAQYINTLQPDWPQGVDPESAGDDHIRMVKQVLQNTFPNIDGPVTSTPDQINQITQAIRHDVASTDPVVPDVYRFYTDATYSAPAAITHASPTKEQFGVSHDLSVNWQTLMDFVYPVGSVIFNTGANPADVLGFGTWAGRAGSIYGAGGATDAMGYYRSIGAGNQTDSYWRVQTGHIVESTIDATIAVTVDGAPDHSHGVPARSEDGGSSVYVATGSGGGDQPIVTESGGAHGHTATATGTVTVGMDSATTGSQLMTPGWAFYVWERTA
ncbi:phage baseplate protein [Citrobacter portucalensis]|uniref:phage baseplate protein n=1 Tax=Citrobacter portucalensis TaxID=1639133 RepID=UPI003EE2A07F